MTYCPACTTPRECDERGCARPDCACPPDLFGEALTRYKVRGKGAFPVDMLRLNASWPACVRDSAAIARDRSEPREVTLASMRAPNFRAWLAASWQVTEINGVML